MSSWEGKTRGGVMGYKIFVWTLQYLGISFAYFLLSFVVTYFMFRSGKAFGAIYRYFRKIHRQGTFRAFISIYRNYYLFGQILLDKVAMLAGYSHRFTFDFDGEEYLRQMENGGLLISGHVGNWEVAGHLLNRLEKKVNIILFDAEHQQIKGYLSDVMTNRNIHFIVIRDDYQHLVEIKEALANKEIVAMHGDRFLPGNKTVVADFMGHPAHFPIGPLNMAAKFKAAYTFVFAVKETRRHYHFYAVPARTIQNPSRIQEREKVLGEAVQDFAREFERILKKYPLQWFNYYDFWAKDHQPSLNRPA